MIVNIKSKIVPDMFKKLDTKINDQTLDLMTMMDTKIDTKL